MNFCTKEGNLEVLDNINFRIDEGEIVALVGPSGSGKTTALNIIAGLLKPQAGEVIVNGDIGYMFQRDNLFEWRSIYKNVILGLEIQKKLTQENLEKVVRMLKIYGLWDFRNNYPSELSGGMRQRVALIRTLATSPALLLLDEPFASLDYQTKLLVSVDIYKIIKQEKKTTIMVTHDLSEAISMSDRIIILTARPAKVFRIHEIKLNLNEEKTPLTARKADNFRYYFDLLWRELNENMPKQKV
ncbi:MAG: ABC transporter ATP-binding protein [Acholeplasmataceae bacterium]|nr:ABC transporter ATP-binding protein [Acholeplasmataceae bacterium]